MSITLIVVLPGPGWVLLSFDAVFDDLALKSLSSLQELQGEPYGVLAYSRLW
jgi:hypothetical protein